MMHTYCNKMLQTVHAVKLDATKGRAEIKKNISTKL